MVVTLEQGAKVMLDDFGPCSVNEMYDPTNKACYVLEETAAVMRMVKHKIAFSK